MSVTMIEPGQTMPAIEHHYLNAEKGIKSWLTTVDHKRIGIMYLISVALFFAIGGLLAVFVRLELLTPGKTIMDAAMYNRVFSAHGIVMVFLFIIPSIPASLGNFLLPIMIGAKDVAFPRLNLASFYIYWAGGILGIIGMLSGAVDTGWTFYAPYSTTTTTVVWMTLAVFVAGFSSILTGLNFVVTIHKMRAPGMTWTRLPLFLWGIYATAIIQVLATPVIGITMLLLMMEKLIGIGIFDPKLGGDPVLYQHFFWFYSHPAVYIMILPAMGVISELMATFSRQKIFGYKAIALSSMAIALVSFLVWGHHMFVAGQSEVAAIIFSAITYLVGVPTGIKVISWVGTMYKGSISLRAPMIYAQMFLFLFTIGGLTGIMLGSLNVDVHLHDTYYVVAHFHYVMMGGTVIAFLGGLHYWWPKMTGKMYNESLAKWAAGLIFIGFNVTFFTQFIMGSQGMPRRYYDYVPEYAHLHAFSTYGSWILGLGLLIAFICFIHSLFKGEQVGADPWGGTTLEWLTTSPPDAHNFKRVPLVTRNPYDYDAAYDDLLGDGMGDGASRTPIVTPTKA